MKTATVMQSTERHSFEFEQQRGLIFYEGSVGVWMLSATKNDIENFIIQNGEEHFDYEYRISYDVCDGELVKSIFPVVLSELDTWLSEYVAAHVEQQEEVEE